MSQPASSLQELIQNAEISGDWAAVADWCETHDWSHAEQVPVNEYLRQRALNADSAAPANQRGG